MAVRFICRYNHLKVFPEEGSGGYIERGDDGNILFLFGCELPPLVVASYGEICLCLDRLPF